MQGTLFSTYFLEEGIRETEDWERLSSDEVRNFLAEISTYFHKVEASGDCLDEVDTEDIERYFVKESKKPLLFPYRVSEEKAELIPENEFKEEYPDIWKYLKENEKRLRNREGGKFNDDEWYRYGRHQNLDKQERKKFGVAETVKRLEVFYDREGKYYFHNVRVNGIIPKTDEDYSPEYLLAVLNSCPLNFYFTRISVPHRGGHFAANKQFLSPLPIPQIDFSDFSGETLEELKKNHVKERKVFKILSSINLRSKTVHDFLSFFSETLTELSYKIHLLERFINDDLEKGSKEIIDVIIFVNNYFSSSIPESAALKEASRRVLKELELRKAYIDTLIDKIVFRMFDLTDINLFE